MNTLTEQKIESTYVLHLNGKTFIKVPKECVYRFNELNLTLIYCILHAGNYYINIEYINEPDIANILNNTHIPSDQFIT